MGGSSTVPGANEGQPGVYGTPGMPAATNIPGGRGADALWTDQSGNLWLFGGYGFDANGAVSYLNDLWELNPSTNEWTWMSGSNTIGNSGGQPGVYGTLGTPTNGSVPGGRAVPSSWIDGIGNLWLFGGYGYDSVGALSTLNDLWQFSPSTKEWTWEGGSSTIGSNFGQPGVYGTMGTPAGTNIPGSRYFSTSWADSSGNFWLFGGYGFAGNGNFGYLNDLWRFNPGSNEWTWIGGSDTVAIDGGGPSGVYGTPQKANSANWPGGRGYSGHWIDSSDNIWIFGGGGFDADGDFGYLNDLWKYNPTLNEWTWMIGSSTVASNSGQPGTYGALETPAAANTPGGRETAIGWTGNDDRLWLFGGSGYDANDTFGSLGDLWAFSPSTNEWTWMGGSRTPGNNGQAGVYGVPGKPAARDFPGSRYYAANWIDSSGVFWLFGGLGEDAGNTGGYLNDLWKFQPSGSINSPTPASTLAGSSATFSWSGGTGVSEYELWVGTAGVGSSNLNYPGLTTSESETVTGLPTNGKTLYVRLYSKIDGIWVYQDYAYTAEIIPAVLTTPTPGSNLTTSSVPFAWSPGSAATEYELWVGTAGVGSSNLNYPGLTTSDAETVTGLPTNGETIYVRLYSKIAGAWHFNDYIYNPEMIPAALTYPTPGSTLTGSSVAFSWSGGVGVSEYELWVGTNGPGSANLNYPGLTTATTETVSDLPASGGGTVYVRLYSKIAGTWHYYDYTYSAQ
jgi:N-acetylneuraminic acid mutarotase